MDELTMTKEYIELEDLETKDEVRKIKTPFAHIVVGGKAEKPCYSIMWWDSDDKELNIGYSSFNIDFVRVWFKEYFEVIENSTYDVVEVVHGEWIEHEWAEEENGLLISNFECSACHNWEQKRSDYCPNCGAKMGGGNKNG